MDVHAVQLMGVAPELEKIRPGMTEDFLKFMGSKDGGEVWDMLFDAQKPTPWSTGASLTESSTLTVPEIFTGIRKKLLPIW